MAICKEVQGEKYVKYKPNQDDLGKLLQMKSTVEIVRRRQEQTYTKRWNTGWETRRYFLFPDESATMESNFKSYTREEIE